MNMYLVYVNGVLSPPDFFSLAPETSSAFGRYLRFSCPDFKDSYRTVDVLEFRGGSLIRRCRWERGVDEPGICKPCPTTF